jgi:microcystin-dependent protein
VANPFVAEIRIFPFNFVPIGWAWCNGQLVPISQNTALFSLIGTFYGGDGKSTFALPDLRGRAAMQWGQGPGLSVRDIGESGGSPVVALLEAEMPAHDHPVLATSDPAATGTPSGTTRLAMATAPVYGAARDLEPLGATAGGGEPHNNMQPYVACYFAIALQGIFPPRG